MKKFKIFRNDFKFENDSTILYIYIYLKNIFEKSISNGKTKVNTKLLIETYLLSYLNFHWMK